MNSNHILNATLSELCTLVTDGTHDTPNQISAGYPLIKAKEIVGGVIDFNNCAFISEEDHKIVIARSKPEYGDTLFAHIGASLGEAAFINTYREFSIKNIALFKPNPSLINDRYLFYLTISPPFQELAKRSRTGSAQPFLSLGHLRNHRVQYHKSIVNQKRIASILSTYDNLIENNTRRIQILEEMAQRIYKKWFVDFKYPDHENDTLIDSKLGMIPEGWEVKSVEQISTVNRGRSYKSVEIKDGLPFINLKSINRQGGYRSDGLKKYSGMYKDSHVVKPNDIVIAVTDMTQDRAIVGRAARVPDEGIKEYIISMDLVSCIPNSDIQMEYLYGMYKYSNYGNQIKEFANGANVLHLLPARIKEFKFSLPPDSIRQKYSIEIQKFYELEDNLFNKNRNLRQTRDLLLPKLISGKIDVSDLDIEIGET